MTHPTYPRILLKLSGEALMGSGQFGIDAETMQFVAKEIKALQEAKVQTAIVVGGGNIFRGAGLVSAGINPVSADQMGMLATAMNALAIQDAVEKLDMRAHVLSAVPLGNSCEVYSHRLANDYLAQGDSVIFAAGTGNPFFTTDSAAALRAAEIQADLMIKATKVDGVYDSDPMKNPTAKRYNKLDYDSVIEQQLGVMDITAVVLARSHQIPLRVLDMQQSGAFVQAAYGENIGTLVS